MMKDYGIHHRISSVANPHPNARAELGVKTVKRMLRDNVSARGTLDRAAVSRALLQLRNTPDRDTKLSPAKALFGRELRDFLPRPGSALMGEMWMNLADAREQALGRRATNAEKQWSEHTKALPPLKVGDTVMVQNQVGNHPLRWDKRGTIVKCEGFDQYQLMIDGSRRLTRRNRKYLRMFTPFQPPQSMIGGDARSAPPRAGAVKPAVSKPASKQPSQRLPGHVQQDEQRQQGHEQGGDQAQVPGQHGHQHRQGAQQEEHGGYVYKPLQDCPKQGTVSDLLEWAIPAAADHQDQGPEGVVCVEDQPAGVQQHGDVGEEPVPHSPGVSRSTRAGKGETNKYRDFVQKIGASATYAQIVSGLGGRGHHW